jgi:cytosine/adenosine deaminase-related metal-dependent hydrolase
MHKLTADALFTGKEVIENFVLVYDKAGAVLDIQKDVIVFEPDVQRLEGWLVPGFINAHCHLELSHMKDQVPTGMGLIAFVTDVVTKRNMSSEIIHAAIREAESDMILNGIVAVGDISNTTDTFAQKSLGNLHYYTFVEMFDLMQEEQADETFATYQKVFEVCPEDIFNRKSIVPHAPYSVSDVLFNKLEKHQKSNQTISLHNQETVDENEMFINKRGGLLKWFADFGISTESFKPIGQSSIHNALPRMRPDLRTILVHNTMSNQHDIQYAEAWNKRVFWCTCPNANLYIENRLPDYKLFLEKGVKMVVGTDSLTSNWSLSILDELKTIKRFASYVPTIDLLKWATFNGAEALGFEETLGLISIGKRPGINLISNVVNGELTQASQVKKVV